MSRVARGALALALGLIVVPGAARAADQGSLSDETRLLCAQTPVPCGIQVTGEVRSGASFPVTVTGRPGHSVPLQAYRAQVRGGRLRGLTPIGQTTIAQLGPGGTSRSTLSIPVGQSRPGWVFVGVDDVAGRTDPTVLLGQFVPLGARRPLVLGDGYGTRKPVDVPLDLQITSGIPGSRFVVEVRMVDGAWRSVMTRQGPLSGLVDSVAGITHLTYRVPAGLGSAPHEFRLRNLSDPDIATEWTAEGSATPEPRDRLSPWTPPAVGEGVAGAALVRTHSTRTVRLGALGASGAAMLMVLLIAAAATRAGRPQ